MNIEILTSGEKIKKVRKELKLKQYDISGKELTRNLISMIETEKAPLTEQVAKILVDNIRKICLERGIDCPQCKVSVEYLIESPEDQCERIAKDFISVIDITPERILEDEFKGYFIKIISILDKYGLKDYKALIYEKLGDFYCDTYDYYSTYYYYVTAFENYTNLFNNLDLIKLIIKIDYCCRHLKKHKKSIEFLSLAKLYMTNLPPEENYKINYNTVITHKSLGEFNIALNYISDIESSFCEILKTSTIRSSNLNILKANCYTELNSYDLALKIHSETLELTKDNLELHLLTLVNILDIYLRSNDRKKLKTILDKCVSLIQDYDQLQTKKYAPNFSYDISSGFYFLECYEQSKFYLKKTLIECNKFKDITITEKALDMLLKIYIVENSIDDIKTIKNEILELSRSNLLPINSTLILDLIMYYNSQNEREVVHELAVYQKKLYS